MTGTYFEDLEPGTYIRHPRGRTITAADNTWFTLLTMNTNQLHFNEQYATGMPLGRVLVNSGLTLAIVLGMSVQDISEHAVANLGWRNIDLVHPVHVGDTIWADSFVQEARPSGSRPNAGVVTVTTRGLNQDGVTFMTFERSVLVLRRSEYSAGPAGFPEPQDGPLTGGTRSSHHATGKVTGNVDDSPVGS